MGTKPTAPPLPPELAFRGL